MKREKLISVREQRGLSQTELAECIGTTQQNISWLENGRRKPNVYLAITLQNFFEVKAEELFPDIFLKIETTKCS